MTEEMQINRREIQIKMIEIPCQMIKKRKQSDKTTKFVEWWSKWSLEGNMMEESESAQCYLYTKYMYR